MGSNWHEQCTFLHRLQLQIISNQHYHRKIAPRLVAELDKSYVVLGGELVSILAG